jgi:hypothetical protein
MLNKSIILIIMFSMMPGLLLTFNTITPNMTVPNEALGSTDLKKEYTWTGPDGHKDKVTLYDFELEDIPDTCDASEDYDRNEKLCNALYNWEEAEEDKERQERIELTQSKAFEHYLSSIGINYDDYDNISAEEQSMIESDFKDEQHHEKDVQIESRVCEDEGGEYSRYGGCDTKGDDKKLQEISEKVSQKLVEREQQEQQEEEDSLPYKLSPYYNSEPIATEEENIDRSYNYAGENEATETEEEREFEEAEFRAEEEDDKAYEESQEVEKEEEEEEEEESDDEGEEESSEEQI